MKILSYIRVLTQKRFVMVLKLRKLELAGCSSEVKNDIHYDNFKLKCV